MHSPLEILTASFADDPLMVYIEPDPARRPRAVAWLARRSLSLAGHGGVIDLVDGEGVALWFPPHSAAFGAPALVRAGFLGAPVALGPRAAARMARSEADLTTAYRPEDAWYFYMLGVHPSAQGRGVARKLIERGLARADRDGAAVRLETNNAENVAIYERFGFEVTAHLDNLTELEQWVMLREPRGSSGPAGA